MNWISRVVYAVVLALAITSPAGAKCARLLIDVTGEVEGDPQEELGLRVDTIPDADENQESPIRDGTSFAAKLRFDPTKGYSPTRGHDCSRDPKVVRVLLLRGDEPVEIKELSFTKDFVEESPGRYSIRKPISLGGSSDARRR